jgi:hypothetical protein
MNDASSFIDAFKCSTDNARGGAVLESPGLVQNEKAERLRAQLGFECFS